jgi:hypothetical protein
MDELRLIILDKASDYVNDNITRYIEPDYDNEEEEENDEENEEEIS